MPLIALLFLLFPFIALAGETLSGRVVRVIDGDTIVVLRGDNVQTKVRLYGIDCPERKQAFGQVARKFAADKVAGRDIDIEITGKANWGRLTGIVGDLNEALVEAGLAWVWDRYCKKPVCAQWRNLEAIARAEKRCLWKEKAVPPWEWRGR